MLIYSYCCRRTPSSKLQWDDIPHYNTHPILYLREFLKASHSMTRLHKDKHSWRVRVYWETPTLSPFSRLFLRWRIAHDWTVSNKMAPIWRNVWWCVMWETGWCCKDYPRRIWDVFGVGASSRYTKSKITDAIFEQIPGGYVWWP